MVEETIKETGERHGVVTRIAVQLGLDSTYPEAGNNFASSGGIAIAFSWSVSRIRGRMPESVNARATRGCRRSSMGRQAVPLPRCR
jgi:hypothetical protein